MRYFKLDGQIFGYDDTQTDLITDEMSELTKDELDEFLNPTQPPVSLPQLTNRQFKLALLDADLLDAVELEIAQIKDEKLKRRIQIEFEYATTFNRNSESIAIVVELLGLSVENVDEIWEQALEF